MMTEERDPPSEGVKKLSDAARAAPPKMKTLRAVEIIETHRRGDFAAAVDQALIEVVEKVSDFDQYGPKGKVTITIEREANGALKLRPNVKKADPEHLVGDGFYFATEQGELTRHDPRQTDLEEYADRRDR